MKEKVYITGHRTPDTDSICSALAYAELKNKLGAQEAIPIRIGELNPETRFVLNYFHVEAPVLMQSMQPTLQEIPIDPGYGVAGDVSLLKATKIIEEHHLNNLPVVNDDEKLVGIVSLSNITGSYANVWDDTVLGRSATPLSNICEVLSADIVVLPEHPREMAGRMNILAMDHFDHDLVLENDVVMVGDRAQMQADAIEAGMSLVILTNRSALADGLEEKARENNVTVIRTALTTFMATRLIPQAVPIRHLMTTENLITFHLDDALDDVQATMARTRFRSYPVLDGRDHVVGSISRYHVINRVKKKLILVDHNESSQSISDMDDVDIVEIIDHHRVANVTTSAPILFRNMPVGCTATIISEMFFEHGIRPSRAMAGLMCSAILSDTLLFRSPTTTDLDRRAVQRLALIANIDPETYAMEMFRAGTDLSNKKPTEILTQDVKFYDVHGAKMKLAQVFTTALDSLDGLIPRLTKRMCELLEMHEEDTYILIMTDIFKERSRILVEGLYGEQIAAEFGQTMTEQGFMAEGVLSRKKQVLPVVTSAIFKVKTNA